MSSHHPLRYAVAPFTPKPYENARRDFELLPPAAKHYLSTLAMRPRESMARPGWFSMRRLLLVQVGFGELKEIDSAITQAQRQARAWEEIEDCAPFSPLWLTRRRRHLNCFEENLYRNLMPRRERLLRKFVDQFDALVWLQTEGQANWDARTAALYRHNMLDPVVDAINLIRLHLDYMDAKTSQGMTQQELEEAYERLMRIATMKWDRGML